MYLLQHAVVYRDLLPMLLLGFSRDKVSLVATVFFSLAYSFYRDRVSFVATNISLALQQSTFQGLSFYLFYVAIILCVVTGIVMLRHRKLCQYSVSMQLLQIGVVTQFLCLNSMSVWFLLQQCFLY